MKKVLLIRHAEAVSHAAGGDFERPLSAKGEQEAMKTATYLQQNDLLPEGMVVSTALRTQTTARILSGCLQIPSLTSTETVYEASDKTLLQVINSWNDHLNFVALVGHNPGIAYLAYYLSNDLREVPPGTAIVLNFEVESWAHISNNTGIITHYFTP